MIQLNQNQRIGSGEFDIPAILMYLFLVFLGWLNIFAAVYDPEIQQSIFDFSINSGKQLLWIGTSVLLIFFICLIDHRFFETFAFVIYAAIILLLLGVLVGGKVVAGSKSWIEIGSFGLQPSEFAKFSTALALSAYLSKQSINLTNLKNLFFAYIIIFSPALLILLQNDTGSTLVFSCFYVGFIP